MDISGMVPSYWGGGVQGRSPSRKKVPGQSRASKMQGSGQEPLLPGFRVMLSSLPTMGKNGQRSKSHSLGPDKAYGFSPAPLPPHFPPEAPSVTVLQHLRGACQGGPRHRHAPEWVRKCSAPAPCVW